jgi:hypothetical protein
MGKKERAAATPLPPISSALFELAKPMMDSMPTPRRLAHVQAAMALAQLAWNLPLLEKKGDPAVAKRYREMVDGQLSTKPAAARELVAQMMKIRLARLGDDERLVRFVEVVQDGEEIRILATDATLAEGL